MKSAWKVRSLCRPNVESLENRMQPGSILTGGMGLSLLGSALDLTSILDDSASSQPALIHRLLDANHTRQVSATEPMGAAPSSGRTVSPQPAERLVIHTGDSGLASQVVAVNVANHASAATSSGASLHSAQFGQVAPTQSRSLPAPTIVFTSTPVQSNLAIQSITAATNLQAATNVRLVAIPVNSAGGINPLFAVGRASYVGNGGTDSLTRIAVDPNTGNVVMAGTLLDPSTGVNEPAIVELDSGLQNLIGAAFVQGGSGSANGVAVDASSVIYFSGTLNAGSNDQPIVGRIPDITNPGGPGSWLFSYNFGDPTANIEDSGAQLDVTGTTLAVTGQADTSSVGGGPGALQLVTLTNLANPAGPSFGSIATAAQFSVPVIGNDIAATSDAKVDIVATGVEAAGNIPLFGQYDGTAFTGGGLFTWNGIVPGPLGGETGIALDGSNNMYMSGSLYAPSSLSLEITANVNSTFTAGGTSAWGATGANFVSNSVALGADLTMYMAGTGDDNSGNPNTHSALTDHFASDGSAILDSGDGTLGGSGDDYGTGVALGAGLFGPVPYFAGTTTSTDFGAAAGYTAGAFQSTYSGGASAGWVASTSLS
jgi:hypothetical protein